MKKVFNSLFVIIAAMVTFAGCAKQEIDAPATPETKTVQFFANSIETKTAFGTPTDGVYPTFWTIGDKVKVFVNLNTVTGTKTEDVVTVDPSDDLTSATFKSTEIQDSGAQDYTFYAVSPSDAYQNSSRNSETNTFTVLIPQTQKPTDNSVDSYAQVIYAVSENYVQPEMPTSVELDFKHFSAYCKLSFSQLSEELGNITQVTLESDVDLAGKWNVNLGEGEHTAVVGSKKIIITTGKSENIWIACAPADLRDKKIKFIIDAEDGSSVSREVTFPNDEKYQFKSGVIANLTIKMDQGVLVKPTVDKCFEKVTSAPSDWTGTYLIVYETGNVAFDGSLTTLDAASNKIPVTIDNSKIVYTDNLMKYTFAIAKNDDKYSIKSSSGKYIGNNSNTNSLTSSTTALNNTLTFKTENEIDVISSGGAYLRFNATSGQERFRYFKSGTYTNQKAIQLYKLVGDESEGGEGGETPVEKMLESIAVSDAKTEYTVEDEFEKPTVTATYSDGSTEDVTASAEFTGYEMSAAGTYTVTVSYSGKTTTYSITVSAAQGGGDEPSSSVTVSKTIADIADANGWTNSTQYSTITLDEVITATAIGGGNTGKYYTSGEDWRLYQTESATLSITATGGYTIKTVKITYTISNSGSLTLNGSDVTSDTEVPVNASSISFEVGGSGTKGQVRVTKIEVVYHQAN